MPYSHPQSGFLNSLYFYSSLPVLFASKFQAINWLSLNQCCSSVCEQSYKHFPAQFDLSMLQELDDNEYLSQMIEIFLSMTPAELAEMEKQAEAGELGIRFQ